jgi:hypothetical protein
VEVLFYPVSLDYGGEREKRRRYFCMSNAYMKMIMEDWWNDTDRRKLKY